MKKQWLNWFLFDFSIQVISCNKNICTLQITDTTGSHQFPAMQRLSITKGHAFILVYSVCSKQSVEELRAIWTLIKELKGQEITQIPVMLVGNKCDESAALREVSELEGKAEAASWGVSFMETSAKNNINVTELFQVSLVLTKRNAKQKITAYFMGCNKFKVKISHSEFRHPREKPQIFQCWGFFAT